jgi:hypothetical protein
MEYYDYVTGKKGEFGTLVDGSFGELRNLYKLYEDSYCAFCRHTGNRRGRRFGKLGPYYSTFISAKPKLSIDSRPFFVDKMLDNSDSLDDAKRILRGTIRTYWERIGVGEKVRKGIVGF